MFDGSPLWRGGQGGLQAGARVTSSRGGGRLGVLVIIVYINVFLELVQHTLQLFSESSRIWLEMIQAKG